MFNKYNIMLWTDELIFTLGALDEQFERYCKSWRECFIKYDESVASVYIHAIKANRRTHRTLREALNGKGC